MTPIDFTYRKPPLEKRMVFAIFFAIAHIRRTEVDVVRDQELARADDRRAGGGVADRVAAIGIALGHTVPISFTSASNWPRRMFSRLVRSGPPRGGFVEIDGHFQPRPDLVCRRAPRGATHSSMVTPSIGMNGTTSAAPMRGCAPWCCVRSMTSTAFSTLRIGRLCNGGGRSDEGQDAAVVIGVLFAVEQHHIRDGEDALDDRIDFGGVAPFGKIRNTLDQLSCHVHILARGPAAPRAIQQHSEGITQRDDRADLGRVFRMARNIDDRVDRDRERDEARE